MTGTKASDPQPWFASLVALSQNEEAEELMRKVEKEEENSAAINPDKQCFHLCIINLVIGTLYCAKVGETSRGGGTDRERHVYCGWIPWGIGQLT
jgi:hypothetical protein